VTDIVALMLDRVARARITETVRSIARPVFCDRVADVLRAVEVAYVRGTRVGAVIIESHDEDGASTVPLVAALRERAPAVPVLAYFSLTAAPSADILAVARAGVSGLILRGHDDVGSALRSALATASDDCAARHILRELEPALPRLAHEVVEHCVQHGREPLTVADVAQALGVHRKTLVNRLTAAGLPPPRVVIAWSRLCLVAYALEEATIPIERVAMDFDFPSATALRNMCKRYTGLRPGQVRANGGLACVLHHFKRVLHGTTEHTTASTAA
jgi:AraC-like DNA-binding protein